MRAAGIDIASRTDKLAVVQDGELIDAHKVLTSHDPLEVGCGLVNGVGYPAAHRAISSFPAGTVRFSFGFNTTQDEIRHGLDALAQLSAQYHNAKGRRHV